MDSWHGFVIALAVLVIVGYVIYDWKRRGSP